MLKKVFLKTNFSCLLIFYVLGVAQV